MTEDHKEDHKPESVERPGGDLQEIAKPDGLDAVAAEAARFDAAGVAQEVAESAPPSTQADSSVSSIDEWEDAVGFGASIVFEGVPELKEKWPQKKLDKFAGALAKAGEHYGWNIQKLLGHPLLGLAVASWPLAQGVREVMREKSAALPPQTSIA